MMDREERLAFLEQRRKGVGSSDLPALTGTLHGSDGELWRDVLDVFHEKTRPPEDDQVREPNLVRGIVLEPVIADLYSEETGETLLEVEKKVGEKPWFHAHADRVIENGNGGEPVEIKAPGRESFDRLLETGFPDYYIVQAQWEMYLFGADSGLIVAGNLEHSRGPIVYHRLAASPELQEQLANVADRFWTQHVEPNVRPDPAEWHKQAEIEIPEWETEQVVVEDLAARRIAHRMMRRYRLRQRAKKLYEKARQEMKEHLSDVESEKIIVPGQGKINWGWREGRTSYKKTLDRIRDHRPIDRDAFVRWLGTHDLELIEHRTEETATKLLSTHEAAEKLADALALDLDDLEVRGDPYRSFRPYPADTLEDPRPAREGGEPS